MANHFHANEEVIVKFILGRDGLKAFGIRDRQVECHEVNVPERQTVWRPTAAPHEPGRS
jgi:hypothetical protein